ncbi:DUF3750 domain-containing protein [Mesorhizobium sp. CAU 1741]|uniref:DUF3750 domain-containing protein n=1 Tax=Mesorhizobium sp. CAU 1741 TaxID=3140366 RepID=UPI00325AF20A
MFQWIKHLLIGILVVFIVPTAATAGWWAIKERPGSWSSAEWGTSGVLPSALEPGEPAIHVMAARTGGLKGALSVHSWLVIRKSGADTYDRYDKVGWGSPIRHNGYAADAFWYSNLPYVVHSVTGDQAARLIPHVEAAIAGYPYATNGSYRIWPGPNSNSFVAHVLNEVPELGATLPPNAIGRDFAPGIASLRLSPDWRDLHATLGGFLGFAAGARSGFEVHFLGLVAGIDVMHPAIKIPALGRVGL